MSKEELAVLLQGREYDAEITSEEETEAESAGLVVVFGASDDLMEFRGAIDDEFGCYGGGDAWIDAEGVLPDKDQIDDDDDDEELEKWLKRKKKAVKITSHFCRKPEDPSWIYKTKIPHSTFDVMEDGEVYCRGIVFNIKDIK